MSLLSSLARRLAPIAAVAGFAGLLLTSPAIHAAPRYDHVVVVVMENHASSQVIGSSSAPYINSLAKGGANLTNSHGVTHPSQPNYLALFSGSTQGITDDSCPHTFSKANLGSQLIAAGLSFVGYSEDLPSAGSTVCTKYPYARKHAPWVNFSNVPATSNLPLTSFPTDYTKLPTVSFVIPNLVNDMHDASVSAGDTWLKNFVDGYAQWAKTHNSLLIVTFDEDDSSNTSNQIATVFYGAGIKPGNYADNVNHYHVLATIQSFYGLSALNTAPAITSIFGTGGGNLLLTNGDFEAGSAGWIASSGVLGNTSGQSAHGGSSFAWLCGYGSSHTDSLKQSITLPAGSRPLLSYWLHIDTAETGSTATDTLKIQVVDASNRTSTLASFSNVNAASGYKQQFLDLSAFAGQTVTLQFVGTESSSKQTSFVLDDLALTLQ